MSDAARSLPLTDLSQDEAGFRQLVRDFAEEKVRPLVHEMDEEEAIPRELIDLCFQLGLMGVEIPEAHGGAAATFFMSTLAIEELARVDPSVAVLVDVQNTLVNNAILRWGTDAQKARYFPRLAESWVGAYALSEADSGSDAFALTCRAEARGDHYELTGRKMWITNAAEAELFIVMATIDPAKGYKGITSFLVERSFPGLAVGKKEAKLGIRASSTCELILEACRVPKDNVLGEPGKGYKIAIETLNEGRIGIGAQMVGLAQGAYELALRYAQERQQFGRPISDFQAVQFELAELATQIEAARLLTYNASRLRDIRLPFVKESAMAKLFASRVAERVASSAIEIHGGYGFTREYPVEKYFRDQKVGQIYEGTSNMQLLVIAKQILGKM
ncbi:MAG: acyl-CoA dehydrogenase [Acidobacteria bacterium]|jgi:butyryl-CoA dehydrogenase/short/branched chain acyl-CoA dehydrogenase|nr:acyl-CoA dehydrogenase [Acidobacteriota bacterium]